MSVEESIKNCVIYLKRIKQYDPDPFYVNYFFNEFINSINKTFDRIFEEANRDFGLFISEKISQETFQQKANMKNDPNAIKFVEWYLAKYDKEHENPYPNFIKKICQLKKNFGKLPEIKIMLRASDRYKDDIYQQIKVNLKQSKIRSKEELEIEIKRQLSVYLEIINHKRKQKNEPKVDGKQVKASAFLDIEDYKDIEISYASEIYIPVLERLVKESRNKIKELTSWN